MDKMTQDGYTSGIRNKTNDVFAQNGYISVPESRLLWGGSGGSSQRRLHGLVLKHRRQPGQGDNIILWVPLTGREQWYKVSEEGHVGEAFYRIQMHASIYTLLGQIRDWQGKIQKVCTGYLSQNELITFLQDGQEEKKTRFLEERCGKRGFWAKTTADDGYTASWCRSVYVKRNKGDDRYIFKMYIPDWTLDIWHVTAGGEMITDTKEVVLFMMGEQSFVQKIVSNPIDAMNYGSVVVDWLFRGFTLQEAVGLTESDTSWQMPGVKYTLHINPKQLYGSPTPANTSLIPSPNGKRQKNIDKLSYNGEFKRSPDSLDSYYLDRIPASDTRYCNDDELRWYAFLHILNDSGEERNSPSGYATFGDMVENEFQRLREKNVALYLRPDRQYRVNARYQKRIGERKDAEYLVAIMDGCTILKLSSMTGKEELRTFFAPYVSKKEIGKLPQ